MFTDGYFDENTGYYGMIGQILDENHKSIGNVPIDGDIFNLHLDDHNANLQYFMEVDLDGDIENIFSLQERK